MERTEMRAGLTRLLNLSRFSVSRQALYTALLKNLDEQEKNKKDLSLMAECIMSLNRPASDEVRQAAMRHDTLPY